jgi:hypothetical protein
MFIVKIHFASRDHNKSYLYSEDLSRFDFPEYTTAWVKKKDRLIQTVLVSLGEELGNFYGRACCF